MSNQQEPAIPKDLEIWAIKKGDEWVFFDQDMDSCMVNSPNHATFSSDKRLCKEIASQWDGGEVVNITAEIKKQVLKEVRRIVNERTYSEFCEHSLENEYYLLRDYFVRDLEEMEEKL